MLAKCANPSKPTRSKQQALRVLVRVRPPFPEDARVAAVVGGNTVTIPNPYHDNGTKSYSFDKVFKSDATQVAVFEQVEILLRDVFEGRNATVFAYGQTGSGKTHTMNAYTLSGPAPNPIITLNRTDAGITYRAVDWIFDHIKRTGVNATVSASFIEIYNDEVYDLLPQTASSGELKKLKIMTANRKVTVQGLSEEVVSNSEEFEESFAVALRHRTTAGTKLNVASSRSHFMVQLTVRVTSSEHVLTSKLSLIDLAGSEDNRYTGNEGERFEESRHINASLFAIRSVVSALKENKSQVPYRNSKITQLLCDSLGGTASALAVICCAPEWDNLQPTHNSLEFAKDCCFIKNCVQVNETRRKSRPSDHSKEKKEETVKKRDEKENEPVAPGLTLESVEQLIKPMVEKMLAEKQRDAAQISSRSRQDLIDRILSVMNGDVKQLRALKFVGEKRASKILEARRNGVFESIQDLQRIGFSTDLLNTILQVNFQIPMNLV